MVIIWLAFSALTDVIIAVSLVRHLVSHIVSLAAEDNSSREARCSVTKGLALPQQTTLSTVSSVVRPSARGRILFLHQAHPVYAVTVQTGSVTAVFAIVDMICFLATVRVQ